MRTRGSSGMRNGRARKCGVRDCCIYKQQTSAHGRTALHALARKGTNTDWDRGGDRGREREREREKGEKKWRGGGGQRATVVAYRVARCTFSGSRTTLPELSTRMGNETRGSGKRCGSNWICDHFLHNFLLAPALLMTTAPRDAFVLPMAGGPYTLKELGFHIPGKDQRLDP